MFSASLRTIPASDCPKKIYFGHYQICHVWLSGTVELPIECVPMPLHWHSQQSVKTSNSKSPMKGFKDVQIRISAHIPGWTVGGIRTALRCMCMRGPLPDEILAFDRALPKYS